MFPSCRSTRGKYITRLATTTAISSLARWVPAAEAFADAELISSSNHCEGNGAQIQWLHSYVTEDKVYCLYLAPDEDSIREHARRVGIPADRVAAVRRLIDPANLK
jgi:Protein of unknown function (DUF4242)